jgi:hypothetical protein
MNHYTPQQNKLSFYPQMSTGLNWVISLLLTMNNSNRKRVGIIPEKVASPFFALQLFSPDVKAAD